MFSMRQLGTLNEFCQDRPGWTWITGVSLGFWVTNQPKFLSFSFFGAGQFHIWSGAHFFFCSMVFFSFFNHVIMGSVVCRGYSAPECTDVPPPHKRDIYSDIYSLGVIIRELVTGSKEKPNIFGVSVIFLTSTSTHSPTRTVILRDINSRSLLISLISPTN